MAPATAWADSRSRISHMGSDARNYERIRSFGRFRPGDCLQCRLGKSVDVGQGQAPFQTPCPSGPGCGIAVRETNSVVDERPPSRRFSQGFTAIFYSGIDRLSAPAERAFACTSRSARKHHKPNMVQCQTHRPRKSFCSPKRKGRRAWRELGSHGSSGQRSHLVWREPATRSPSTGRSPQVAWQSRQGQIGHATGGNP